MIIYQGNTYKLPVKLKRDGLPVTTDNVKTVEFCFGNITKKYPEDVTFTDDTFMVALTQEDTFALQGVVMCQMRVLFTDGTVECTDKEPMSIYDSISKVVLK